MKRFLAFLFTLAMCWTAAVPGRAEEELPAVYSYDFDLRFHMNADIYPVRQRAHMQGYAELLNMLGLKGNLTYCPSTKSFDLNAEIIPVTNPSAAVAFRLYGIPEQIGLSSPLLGEETIWFQNIFLMEFAYKTWNNLRFPLQYPVLLYPYVTESAFNRLSSAWFSRFGGIRKSTSFSRKELVSLADDWSAALHDDSRLKYWLFSLTLPSEKGSVVESEFFSLPEYLLCSVFPEGGMSVKVSDGSETWTDSRGNVLFSSSSLDDAAEWTLTLPVTGNGYLPRMSYIARNDSENSLYSFSLDGTYSLSENFDGDRSVLPESLFDISLAMNNFPAAWPMNAVFDASLKIGGVLYPNTAMSLRGTGTESGYVSLTLSEPIDENETVLEVFTCSGTILPAVPSVIPEYSIDDFSSFLSIFNVSDKSMDDFIHRVRRPLFMGILNFLDELPPSSCQSVMDDLEEYGVLDLVLTD